MTHTLDFSTLPSDASFERRSILIGPPQALTARLAPMPQTLERVESSVWLASQSSKQSEPWRAAALLRASLADYCAIEEMQKLDRPGEAYFRIAGSPSPLLHLLELLRHLNIHVRTVETAAHAISVQLDDQTSDMNVYVISNLEAHDLAGLKNGKHYNKADIERSVAWFKTRQMEWGAGDLVSLGQRYSEPQSARTLGCDCDAMTANPSLERTSTGKALGPRDAQVHAAPRGPSALPVASAQLKR